MKKLGILLLAALIISVSCKKKSSSTSGEKTYTFSGLKSDHDTILKGNVTNIRAQMTGDATCSWNASAGDIFGSGATILFGASTCCTGTHTINCTVKDRNNNSDTKSVTVYVK